VFKSFFPSPRWFAISAVVWALVAILFWFFVAKDAGAIIGLENPPNDAEPIIGFQAFYSKPFVWFYLYFTAVVLSFATVWRWLDPHPWFEWSVLGSALIVFLTYYSVEIDVGINAWYGPFYDLIAKACTTPGSVSAGELYAGLLTFAGLIAIWVPVYTLQRFFVRHFIFRWRTAMHQYYSENWSRLRTVEGAAQRIQDDTMQFARSMENEGASILNALLTLIAFLPILYSYSTHITVLPIVGHVPQALVWASIAWAVFGTTFLALIGVRLPGLEFKNQRVEAALRKELVYGEDELSRAAPITLKSLFTDIRRNYFTLYRNYLYFDFGKMIYINADTVYSIILLIPSVAAGVMSFGLFQQISNAFDKVRSSVQVVVSDWDDIIRLLSIYKRLRAFEAAIEGDPMSSIETDRSIV
jgi:peptide/bleomycin uptake transporter